MDTAQAHKWLHRLHGSEDSQDTSLELLFTHPENGPGIRRTRLWPSESLKVLDEMERAEAAGFNVYASVVPREVQASGMLDRVWVDQDDPNAPWPFGADERWEYPAWPRPNVLVKTSDGGEGGIRYQAIWLLSAPVGEDEGRTIMKALAKRLKSDGSVHDARRVLRVPGIINAKRGSQTQLMSTETGPVSPDTFQLPAETDLMAKLLATEVSNPQHVLGEWLAGTSEGDRARKAYVCARFLKGCGVNYQDAAALLKLGALRSDPEFSEREVIHCLDSAYHRAD